MSFMSSSFLGQAQISIHVIEHSITHFSQKSNIMRKKIIFYPKNSLKTKKRNQELIDITSTLCYTVAIIHSKEAYEQGEQNERQQKNDQLF